MPAKQRALTFDSRGRITIPAALRRGLGKEFVAIRMPDEIVLRRVRKHIDLPVAASEASGDEAAMEEA